MAQSSFYSDEELLSMGFKSIGKGCMVGACSMVKSDLEPWGIYYGIPIKRAKDRRREMMKYAK